jgi:tRNA G10  N-methylase Trm11
MTPAYYTPAGGITNKLRATEAAAERGGVTPFNLLPIANTNSRTSGGAFGHGAATPLALCDWWHRYLVPPGGAVLDPFCGTGVILQEALLMGYAVYGTDLSPKMIDYSAANIHWLLDGRKMKEEGNVKLEQADATNHTWGFSTFNPQPSSFSIATETYLGQPLGGQNPSEEKLREIVHGTNEIVREFLKNIAPQLPAGTRLCLAVPAWFANGSLTQLPVTSELAPLGFLRHTFRHAVAPLIYRREDQVTGRELLVLEKE